MFEYISNTSNPLYTATCAKAISNALYFKHILRYIYDQLGFLSGNQNMELVSGYYIIFTKRNFLLQ